MKEVNYVNRFAYLAAYMGSGFSYSRIKDQVWIDTHRSDMNDLIKLARVFDSKPGGVYVNLREPMKIKFSAYGGSPSFANKPNMDQYWSWVKWYEHKIEFRWYAQQHLSGSENSKWTIKFEVKLAGREWFIEVPHHQGRFSNKELVKLLLMNLI